MKLRTQFEFDSAHRLVGYDGKCSNLHGHIWKCELEIESVNPELIPKLDDTGILWDFSTAKMIKDCFDHKTILMCCKENNELHRALVNTCGRDSIYMMNENPTAENLCLEIGKHCKMSNSKLIYTIRVWESPKSYAEITV
ncbi:6-carboxytetrahydropterin synthase [Candidatus Pacearchaeota archaeon]|nr:6-carboxytetrahydropterin synthase [Candidatus Pacearchaeota archaeon]